MRLADFKRSRCHSLLTHTRLSKAGIQGGKKVTWKLEIKLCRSKKKNHKKLKKQPGVDSQYDASQGLVPQAADSRVKLHTEGTRQRNAGGLLLTVPPLPHRSGRGWTTRPLPVAVPRCSSSSSSLLLSPPAAVTAHPRLAGQPAEWRSGEGCGHLFAPPLLGTAPPLTLLLRATCSLLGENASGFPGLRS